MTRYWIRLSAGFLILVLFAIPNIYGQSNNNHESTEIYNIYNQVYGVDHRLVSGSFYYGPKRGSITGHPFLINNEWKQGSVTSGNLNFKNLWLKFDIETNKLILRYTSNDKKESQLL